MIKGYQQFDLWGKKIFEKAIIEPPFRLSAQMPNEACFYYVVRGTTKVIAPTETIRRDTDEGLVMQCGNYLNDYLAHEEGGYCEAIAVHFYPEVLKMIYDKEVPDFLREVKKVKPFGYEKLKATALIKNYIENLQFYFDNPELVSEELLKLKLKELILLLAKTNNAEALHHMISSLFSEREFSFKEVVEANIYNNLSLEELATLTHLSLSSFKRTFAKHYQESPAKYIKKRKLQKAAQLLKRTSLRISDIAFDCGFTDLAHFSRSFQKEYDLSPSNYRLD
ncbi:MAG: AraC family transcriptional regulator [Chitinophagales bacterium]|nr:AraC family transcriptional regulator [Chitinophagales bacterium]